MHSIWKYVVPYAATSTPANGAEEATGVLKEEVAAVVFSDTPEGAVTASTKPPNVSSVLFQFNLQTFHG